MSAARPMTTLSRCLAYSAQNRRQGAVKLKRGDRYTPRQYRRAVRKSVRNHTRRKARIDGARPVATWRDEA